MQSKKISEYHEKDVENLISDSKLNKSRFRGFFNMMAIFASVFIFTKPLLNKI